MEDRMFENNRVAISGEIVSDFEFGHEVYGEKFYTTGLCVKRKSNTSDFIPIMVSDRLVDVKADWKGRQVKIEGQFRSYNKHEGNRNMLILSVFAREFEEIEELPFSEDENHISLDGFICKEPKYRETPLGREIADILIAVNRPYGKSDYMPCIAWGRNARFAGELGIGERIQIEGRIQSREYQKRISDTETETRTAYEVSVGKINVVEETEDNAEKLAKALNMANAGAELAKAIKEHWEGLEK